MFAFTDLPVRLLTRAGHLARGRKAAAEPGRAVSELEDALERALRTRVRGRALAPIARIRTERHGVLVLGAGGACVEVVDDHVTAHTMGSSTSALAWREVEVELGGQGDPGLLDRALGNLLENALRHQPDGGRRPGQPDPGQPDRPGAER